MHGSIRVAVATFTAAVLAAPAAAAVAQTDTATAAVDALPASIAVLGDSISAGTGATGGDGQGGWPGETRPQNSWATGDRPGLDSVFQRLREARGPEATTAINLAENGSRARDVLGQAQRSPADVGTFQVQIGGNDLCRPTVEEMTPVAEYRAHLDATLAWIAAERPQATVQLNSVPDIYRLWELRRSNWVAVLFWASGVIPCQSLLASPTSTSAQNMARREAVRARGLEYNQQLREACAQVPACHYDDDAAWRFSNDPARFVDGDISTQDHFHPSFAGQRKLAEVAWDAGFGAGAWWSPQVPEPAPAPDDAEVPDVDAAPDDAEVPAPAPAPDADAPDDGEIPDDGGGPAGAEVPDDAETDDDPAPAGVT